jgi:hypothetical protein
MTGTMLWRLARWATAAAVVLVFWGLRRDASHDLLHALVYIAITIACMSILLWEERDG